MRNDIVHVAKSDILVDSVTIAEMLEVQHSDLTRTIKDIVKRLIRKYPNEKTLDNKINHTVSISGKRRKLEISEKSDSATQLSEKYDPAAQRKLKHPPKFFTSSYTNNRGKKYPKFEMNEQAYMKLAMQLKGYEKAEIVQDMIIEAFSIMKEALLNHKSAEWLESRTNLKAIRRTETDIIKQFVDYATEQGSKNAQMYYINITKMTNKALEFLVQVKQGAPIRDLFNLEQHFFIGILEHRASEAIKFGMQEQMFYKDIYKYAKNEVNTLAASMKFKPEPEMINQ